MHFFTTFIPESLSFHTSNRPTSPVLLDHGSAILDLPSFMDPWLSKHGGKSSHQRHEMNKIKVFVSDHYTSIKKTLNKPTTSSITRHYRACSRWKVNRIHTHQHANILPLSFKLCLILDPFEQYRFLIQFEKTKLPMYNMLTVLKVLKRNSRNKTSHI